MMAGDHTNVKFDSALKENQDCVTTVKTLSRVLQQHSAKLETSFKISSTDNGWTDEGRTGRSTYFVRFRYFSDMDN